MIYICIYIRTVLFFSVMSSMTMISYVSYGSLISVCISKFMDRDHFWRCSRRWFRIGCDLRFWRKPRDGNHQRSGGRSRCDNAARHLNWTRNWETIWDRILGLLYWRTTAGGMGIRGRSSLFACSSTKQVHRDRLWTLARSSTRRCLISRSATLNRPRVSSDWRQAFTDSLLAHCRRPGKVRGLSKKMDPCGKSE